MSCKYGPPTRSSARRLTASICARSTPGRSRRSIEPGSSIRCCSSVITLTDEIVRQPPLGERQAPVQETGQRFVEGHPEIYVVSNVVQDGVAIGSLGSGEATWHTDMSYLPRPPKASALYALEVPAQGGDTSFCSMYAAWETLPDRLQRRVEGVRVKHDGTYNSGGYPRQGVTPTTIRAPRPARFTRSSTFIRKPGGAACISAGVATPTSKGCHSRIPTRCSTTSGPRRRVSRSRGGTGGRSAISCCGTTGARCIAATRSTRRPAA